MMIPHLKNTFNTSNHGQRTVEIDSSLTGATDYIRKQKKYSQDDLETHQEKETETRNRDPCASLFPKWHEANSYKNENGPNNRLDSILREGGHQISDGNFHNGSIPIREKKETHDTTDRVGVHCQTEEEIEGNTVADKETSLVDMTTHARIKSTKNSSIEMRKEDRNCNSNVATIHSDQGNTNTHLVNETKGLKSTLEEDLHHSKYHCIDPEVATGYNMDQGEITSHVKVDKRCQIRESTNLSSNHWEESDTPTTTVRLKTSCIKTPSLRKSTTRWRCKR